jgi:hypothetical protein
MIATTNSIWHPISGQHRGIRWDYWLNKQIPQHDISEYLILAERHLQSLISFHRNSFNESYRRRAESFNVEVSTELNVSATAKNENGYYKIAISLGTILSLEDLNHSLLSDKKTILGLCKGESSSEIEHVQFPFNKIYDHNRFYDYSDVIHNIKVKNANITSASFIPVLFKALPISSFRQKMADLMTDLGLYWILCHEEAHIYLGHVRYIESSLNAYSETEISFSELISSLSDRKSPRHRQSAELEADINATTKLIDYFLDIDLFEAYPFLEDGFYAYHNILIDGGFTEKESRTSYMLQIIIGAVSSCLSLFQRCVVKGNADSTFYPAFLKRMINIIVSSFDRCMTNSQSQPKLGLAQLSGERNANILHLLSLDLRTVANNVLNSGYNIIDDAMNTTINAESIQILTDVQFGQSLIEFYTLLRRHMSLNLISNYYHAEFFTGLSKDRCEYIDILKKDFLKFRLIETPDLVEKVLEDSDQQQRFKEYLQGVI